jgi:hypothetical protein
LKKADQENPESLSANPHGATRRLQNSLPIVTASAPWQKGMPLQRQQNLDWSDYRCGYDQSCTFCK